MLISTSFAIIVATAAVVSGQFPLVLLFKFH